MAKMYLMCGLSGVGKTTFAIRFAREHGLYYLGVDDFYAKVNGDECIHDNQFEVWIEFFKAIHELEMNNIDCIVDTNALTKCHRDQFIDWFPTFEHHLIMVQAPESLRYYNNRKRRRVVPESVMTEMKRNFEVPSDRRESIKWVTIRVITNNGNVFEAPIFIRRKEYIWDGKH